MILKKFIDKRFLWIDNLATYQIFILVGFIMAILTLGKILNFYYIDSDVFWFLAGVGLIIEGSISLVKQKRFEKKYKIIEREE